MEVVFIASCPHSGSTLLDLMLGGHPRFIGLGEVYALIDPKYDRFADCDDEICSCGRKILDCRFWGSVLPRLRTELPRSVQRRYEIVLSAFAEQFGAECVAVDSSKHQRALRALRRLDPFGLRVLHLLRDVRAWTVSMRDAYHRRRPAGVTTSCWLDSDSADRISPEYSSPVRFRSWRSKATPCL